MKISIVTQKGGTGKSTITTILANRLHFRYGMKVLIIDCDLPQKTIYSNRKAEIEFFKLLKEKKQTKQVLNKTEQVWVREFERSVAEHGMTAVDVLALDEKRINHDYNQIDKIAEQYDVVLYDFKGSLENTAILHVILKLNFILVLLEPDSKSASKSIATAAGIHKLMQSTFQKESCLENIFLLFNKVKPQSASHQNEMRMLYQSAAKRGFKFLSKSDGTPFFVDDRVKYQHVLACSVLSDNYYFLRYTKMDAVITAIITEMGYGK